MGRKTMAAALAVALVAATAVGLAPSGPVGADGTTGVPVTCSGIPIVGTTTTTANVEAADSVDPVTTGGAVTNTIRVPVPIEDVPLDVTVTEIKVTFPVPFNVAVTGVTFTPSSFSSQTWALSGSNVVVTLAGSVALGPGKPLPTVPEIKVATTVSGFPRTLSWKVPSSIVAKANAGFPFGNITATCTPTTPTQELISTTVVAANQAPTATDRTLTVPFETATPVTVAGTDPESSPLTYAVATPPGHGTLSGTAPALTYTPAGGYSGPDSFTFTVSDGAKSDTGTVSITVETASPTAPGSPAFTGAPTPLAKAARISWTAPASTGGTPITGYVVQVTQGATVHPEVHLGPEVRTMTHAGLVDDVPATFRLVAENAVGESAPVTSAATTPRPWLPFASTTVAVTKLHQWVVGRVPTTAERTLWVGRIDARTHSTGDLAAALRRSADNVKNVDPVARLYAAYFLRVPDTAGMTHWIAQSRRGTTLADISKSFSGSNEFKARYGPLTNRQFVELIYTNILGRPGEASGIDFWTGQLNSGKKNRGGVMIGFSESLEYKAKQARNVDAALAYVLLAGRTPTVAERNLAATALLNQTLAQVAAGVLHDPAVAARP
jgi:hypothetical protein